MGPGHHLPTPPLTLHLPARSNLLQHQQLGIGDSTHRSVNLQLRVPGPQGQSSWVKKEVELMLTGSSTVQVTKEQSSHDKQLDGYP